jgi:hypothetical protein
MFRAAQLASLAVEAGYRRPIGYLAQIEVARRQMNLVQCHIPASSVAILAAPQTSAADSLSAIIGITGTLVSLVLGGLSIWLSMYFFRRATEAERRADQASQTIATSLEVIQKIHDKMYTDLFGMTKDAYDDIRAKAFGASAIEAATRDRSEEIASANVDEAKREMQRTFDQLLSRLDSTDGQVKALASITRPLIAKAVERGKAAADVAQASAIEKEILAILARGPVTAEAIMTGAAVNHTPQAIIETIRRLYASGATTWSTPTLEADTMIKKATS